MPHLAILGTRGIPAKHGGFETFAERLALHLARQPDWTVTVYCQGSDTDDVVEDEWEGIRLVHIPVKPSIFCTIQFDIAATRHARKEAGSILTLGYNTGFLCIWLRACGRTHFVNMDGVEWKRAKYRWWLRGWFWFNEHFAARFATGMIADHKDIAAHLSRGRLRNRAARITTIVYGADEIADAPVEPLAAYGLRPRTYFTLIARPEPENSILEIVQAFAAVPKEVTLVVLGNYDKGNRYHAQVLAAAPDNVIFPGAIYDQGTVAALRFHSIGYLHGHRVGGTNPSLVEALGAGNAVIAHENNYNRWVAADAALYFADRESCAAQIIRLVEDADLRAQLSAAARRRWAEEFRWEAVLQAYQRLLATEDTAPQAARRWYRRPAPHPIEPPSLTPSSA